MKKPAIDFKENVGKYVSMTYRHMAAALSRKLAPLNIGPGQYSYLFALFVEDGQSQQSLARTLAVDKAAATRAIAQLERKGFVRRETDENDRRANRVRLTARAKAIRPKLERAGAEILEQAQEGLSGRDKAHARRILRHMARNVMRQK